LGVGPKPVLGWDLKLIDVHGKTGKKTVLGHHKPKVNGKEGQKTNPSASLSSLTNTPPVKNMYPKEKRADTEGRQKPRHALSSARRNEYRWGGV